MTPQPQPKPDNGPGVALTEKEPPCISSSPTTTTTTSTTTRRASSDEEKQDAAGGDDGPPAGEKDKERWNHPRTNIRRLGACFYSFIIMGANDAAYGPLIPSLQEYYHLSYIIISLAFLSPFVGYTAAAFLNNAVHTRLGRRGVAVVASCAHLAAYAVVAARPPYPVLVMAFAIAGFGNGVADAAWNAFVGNLESANELLGLLHGLYGVGAVISPLVASAIVEKAGLPWYTFYYVMIGLAGLELAIATVCFWTATAEEYRESVAASSDSSASASGGLREVLLQMPAARVAWLCAVFLLGYVGAEVALGGWIVEFMIKVRHGPAFESGITATGFWLGLTVGRFVLGFITPRIGEKLAIIIYLVLSIAFELVFWLVPHFVASAVAVALVGFFIGPLFPSVIIVMSKLLPVHLHVSAIGFAAAFGGSGAAILPFGVGAIAQAKGVQVLQPVIVALFAALLLVWCALPRIGRKKD
ncbi:putative MFS transporter [Nemania sp. NC0429]|nr:putative MFS transporter [Nemania sp. NC0429]